MTRVLKGSHSFTCTPTRSSAIGMSHTCLCLPSYSWYSLPTTEEWKAELAWVAGYVVRQFTCPKAVTHPTINRAQCRATALIVTVLSLYQTATHSTWRVQTYPQAADMQNSSKWPYYNLGRHLSGMQDRAVYLALLKYVLAGLISCTGLGSNPGRGAKLGQTLMP